jgi:hypothetical protein
MFKIFSGIVLMLLIALSLLIVPVSAPFVGIGLVILAAIPATRSFAFNKAYHLWIAYDRYCNAYLFHDSRETISSRLGKSIYHDHPPVFNFLIIDKAVAWLLNNVDRGHCKKSINFTVGRNADWNKFDELRY